MRTTITLPLAAALFALTAAGTARAPQAIASTQRSLEVALQRAQKDLEGKLELWVDHSTWEKAWQVESPHYVVRTTRSHWFGKEMSDSLELMYPRFQELLSPKFEPNARFAIHVHPDIASYNTFGENNGAEHSSFYGSFFAQQNSERPVASLFDANPTLMRMYLTHSATHQFLDRAYTAPRLAWVEEGLASYFELMWDYEYAVKEFKRMKAAGQLIPLRQLLTAPIQQYTSRTHDRFIQLGMVFYYLLFFREDTRTVKDGEVLIQAPFNDYLRDMLAGKDLALHPVHELITQRSEELERDFQAFDAWQ